MHSSGSLQSPTRSAVSSSSSSSMPSETRSLGSLSVFVYVGAKKAMQASSSNPALVADVNPLRLKDHDIVITSFEVLKEELYQTESPYVLSPQSKVMKQVSFGSIFFSISR